MLFRSTQVTLSVNYAGTTASGAVYAIGTSFTVPDNFPEMSQGDIETATIFTRAMRKIQGKISSILAGGSDANFTTMPQVGGDPIVESGSNADGEWTRWADGTQICSDVRGGSGAHSGSTGVTGLNASDAIWEWTYPSSFVGTVAAVITAGRSNDDVRKFWTTYTVITTSYVRYRTLATSTVPLTFNVSRIATGRWK